MSSQSSNPQDLAQEPLPPHAPSAYNLFMAATAVVAIGVLVWAWTLGQNSEIHDLLMIFDWGFCLLFFIDFLHTLFTTDRKLRYLCTWGPFDLISSIPVMGPFRLARIGALFRILRVIRSIRILSQVYSRDKAAAAVAILMIAGISTIVVVSVAVLNVERTAPGASIVTAEDAAWWGVVTVSTVGYGDLVPVTQTGRVLTTVLMIVGIGLFATFAGAIANVFVRQVQRSTNVDSLEDRLIRIERLQHELQTHLKSHQRRDAED